MKNESIINRAVAIAQQEPKDWPLGHVVAHPSEDTAAKLEKIDGDTAMLRFMDGRRLSFPISEVFDPNRCMRIALEIRTGIRGEARA